MTCVKAVLCAAGLALLGGIVFTQETAQKTPAKGDTAPSAADKPATHKVEKKNFKIELTVKGILQAQETAEISFRPQPSLQGSLSQGPLTISKIVEHGSAVKKGDLLAAFETTKIDEAIKELESDRKQLDINITLAKEELPLFEKSLPLELAAAETAKKRADEDLKYFLDVGRPQTEKQVEMQVKSEKYYLEYQQEQLRQLEKMYKSNDLTEETEKIILRRQQQSLEMAIFWYQQALIERDYIFKFSLPNREKSLKENQAKQDLNLEKAEKTSAPSLSQKRTSLAQMLANRDKLSLRLENHLKDRTGMTIVSPVDGVAYHGKFHHGQWTATDNLADRLISGGTVSPQDVFLTVVKPRPVAVHVNIDEKDAHLVKAGLEGKAKMVFDPDRKLTAIVARVSAVPSIPGKFAAVIVLDTAAGDADLMPGMACSVKLVPYSKTDAIAVPIKCIHEEDDKHFVDVAGKDGKHEKREVTTGRTDGERTEIMSGLSEGEEILLERPKTPGKTTTPAKAKDKGELR